MQLFLNAKFDLILHIYSFCTCCFFLRDYNVTCSDCFLRARNVHDINKVFTCIYCKTSCHSWQPSVIRDLLMDFFKIVPYNDMQYTSLHGVYVHLKTLLHFIGQWRYFSTPLWLKIFVFFLRQIITDDE